MNVFGIGLPEMAVIAAIALLVFGPKRLPEMGRSLGRTLKGFQSASSEFEKEFRSALSTAETEESTAPGLPERSPTELPVASAAADGSAAADASGDKEMPAAGGGGGEAPLT
jgi:sec-independent protein translocase protein TatA